MGNGFDRLTPLFNYKHIDVVDYVRSGPPGEMSGGLAGEAFVRSIYDIELPVGRKYFRPTPSTIRYPDVISERELLDAVNELILLSTIHESKVGFAKGPKVVEQARRDGILKKDPENQIEDVIWHFFVSTSHGNFGASDEVLRELAKHDIKIVLHLVS